MYYDADFVIHPPCITHSDVLLRRPCITQFMVFRHAWHRLCNTHHTRIPNMYVTHQPRTIGHRRQGWHFLWCNLLLLVMFYFSIVPLISPAPPAIFRSKQKQTHIVIISWAKFRQILCRNFAQQGTKPKTERTQEEEEPYTETVEKKAVFKRTTQSTCIISGQTLDTSRHSSTNNRNSISRQFSCFIYHLLPVSPLSG